MKNLTRPVSKWPLVLELDTHQGSQPLFVQIARSISGDVSRGRLRAGARLPGSRELATRLGVHRNTVLAAYQELMAEGWIQAQPGRGTFVSHELPEAGSARARGPAWQPSPGRDSGSGFPLPDTLPLPPVELPVPGRLYLYGGVPDLRLLPQAALSRAYRRALRRADSSLAYGDPRGHRALREALATMLSATRGLALDADGLVITRGSQMALALGARAVLSPADTVLVEEWGYRPAWEAFRLAGADVLPIPVDAQGLDVAAVERLCRDRPVRAVYITPHHQYPTTVSLSAPRRLRLLELAREHRLAIFEDDYDHEFHYQGRPLLPLASADRAGVVVYIGTLSKVLAPGLRVGYVVAAREVLERVALLRTYLDRQGDHTTECAIAELIEEGELARHLWRTRRIYQARRDFCVQGLRERFGDQLQFTLPPGGISLWTKVARVSVERWLACAKQLGVAFQSARQFAWDGKSRPYARIGYASLDEAQMSTALALLDRAWQRAARTG